MSCRGMNTSVSYCRPNEHAEKAWWTEWQSVFRSINTLLAKKYFWFWRSFFCVLVDDNATGSSSASASAGTLVTTHHKSSSANYFSGSVETNQQYAHKWKEKIRISQCISCSDLSTEVEHLYMWQKKIIYLFSRLVQCRNRAQWRCL